MSVQALDTSRNFEMLISEMILYAIYDVRSSDGSIASEAKEWLTTDGPAWLRILGIDVQPIRFRTWVRDGCPLGGCLENHLNEKILD